MLGTDFVSAINVHICSSVVPGRAGGYVPVPGRSAAYENQALQRPIAPTEIVLTLSLPRGSPLTSKIYKCHDGAYGS